LIVDALIEVGRILRDLLVGCVTLRGRLDVGFGRGCFHSFFLGEFALRFRCDYSLNIRVDFFLGGRLGRRGRRRDLFGVGLGKFRREFLRALAVCFIFDFGNGARLHL